MPAAIKAIRRRRTRFNSQPTTRSIRSVEVEGSANGLGEFLLLMVEQPRKAPTSYVNWKRAFVPMTRPVT